MKKSIALATLIVVLLGGIVFQYYITALPDLEQPIRVEKARLNTQTGSVSVQFVDNEGDAFNVGVRGSEEAEREIFPAYFIRNPDFVPYMYWPNIGGPDERALLRFLEGWLERNVDPGLVQRLEQRSAEALSDSEREIAAVYEVYALLRERHQGR